MELTVQLPEFPGAASARRILRLTLLCTLSFLLNCSDCNRCARPPLWLLGFLRVTNPLSLSLAEFPLRNFLAHIIASAGDVQSVISVLSVRALA